MEQVKGIEPSQSAWKAEVLPLNYTCIYGNSIITQGVDLVNILVVVAKIL
jgi:hypothetical protein